MSELATLATLVVNMLTALLPLMGSTSSGVEKVIEILIQVLPIAVSEAEALVTPIQNIITALQGNATITPAQMSALQELQAQTDAAFEAAATGSGVPQS